MVLVEVGWWIISGRKRGIERRRIDMVEVLLIVLSATPEQFHHLRLRVAGSEKTRDGLGFGMATLREEFTHH